MTRLVEMRVADTAAGESYGGASAGFAERHVSAANADGGRDTALAEIQANAGKDFDRAAHPGPKQFARITSVSVVEKPAGVPSNASGARSVRCKIMVVLCCVLHLFFVFVGGIRPQ